MMDEAKMLFKISVLLITAAWIPWRFYTAYERNERTEKMYQYALLVVSLLFVLGAIGLAIGAILDTSFQKAQWALLIGILGGGASISGGIAFLFFQNSNKEEEKEMKLRGKISIAGGFFVIGVIVMILYLLSKNGKI